MCRRARRGEATVWLNGDLTEGDIVAGRDGDMMGPVAEPVADRALLLPPCPRRHMLLWARDNLYAAARWPCAVVRGSCRADGKPFSLDVVETRYPGLQSFATNRSSCAWNPLCMMSCAVRW